jgi:hypothetical protein
VDNGISEEAWQSDEEHAGSDDNQEDIENTHINPIADAIRAYHRRRDSHERYRAKRERINIVVLGLTAASALVAAFAAIYSSWIFLGQLGEMHQASIDTALLASTAGDTETRQLRAYIGPVFDSFRLLPTKLIDCEPDAPPDKALPQNVFCYRFKNYGLTPARIPHQCLVIFVNEEALSGTLNRIKNIVLDGCAPNPLPTISTIWPQETRLALGQHPNQRPANAISKIFGGKDGFLFGRITYYDVFRESRKTDICQVISYDNMLKLVTFKACRIEGPQDD